MLMPPPPGRHCTQADQQPVEAREISPPRQRKPVAPNTTRQFSWATQRIAELTAEVEKTQAKLKASSGAACAAAEGQMLLPSCILHAVLHAAAFRPAEQCSMHTRGSTQRVPTRTLSPPTHTHTQEVSKALKARDSGMEAQLEQYKATIAELRLNAEGQEVGAVLECLGTIPCGNGDVPCRRADWKEQRACALSLN